MFFISMSLYILLCLYLCKCINIYVQSWALISTTHMLVTCIGHMSFWVRVVVKLLQLIWLFYHSSYSLEGHMSTTHPLTIILMLSILWLMNVHIHASVSEQISIHVQVPLCVSECVCFFKNVCTCA